jgi:3-oxoacyl-[acyl-carrier protein] reductase
MDLKGKIAVVTGSARGIGKAIAEALSAQGALVIISDINQADADACAKEIKAQTGVETGAKALNVTDSKAVDIFFQEIIKEYGQLDILVNNAGITKDTLMIRMKDDDWDMVLDVNLKGVFLCSRAALKAMMKKRRGKIISIASVVGLMGNVGQANYSASKGGVIALTKTMAREAAARGINVNAIAPGFIETAMTKELSDEVVAGFLKNIPFGRMGLPEDIANTAVFLASDQSKYITGQVITVDGGLVM